MKTRYLRGLKILIVQPQGYKKTLLFFCEADIEMITISYFKKNYILNMIKVYAYTYSYFSEV